MPKFTPTLVREIEPVDARGRILAAAADLLAAGGREAVTTRSVAAAAGVQAPTLYRLFGDKRGLLDAVAEQAFSDYVADKTAIALEPDPLADFRQGWDRHIAFGLAHPALFALISGDPQPGRISPAAAAGQMALSLKIRRLAAAGMLRVSEPRAIGLTHAACTGAVLTLLDTAESIRDLELATVAREAVVAAIANTSVAPNQTGAVSAAITLRASIDETAALTAGERLLLSELLDRIAGELPKIPD